MNYFAHGLAHVDRPYFLAGTALPDWLSVADRKVRLREKTLTPHLGTSSATAADLAAGALRHLDDDAWFHTTRAFAEVSAELGLLFREGLGGTDGFRCGFLGHITLELLIDAALAERYPARLEAYYAALSRVDAMAVEEWVAQTVGRRPERLAWFVELFQREQILRDYADDERLLFRLNQVLKRVKLTPLPDAAAEWIGTARDRVGARLGDLLPAPQFDWPAGQ
jgi:hypothetical protein